MRAALCLIAVMLAACGPDVITPLQVVDGEFAPPRDRGPPLDESVPARDAEGPAGDGPVDAAGDGPADAAGDGAADAAGDGAAGDGAADDAAVCGDAEASADAGCSGDGAA